MYYNNNNQNGIGFFFSSKISHLLHFDRQRKEDKNPEHSPLHTPITNSTAFSYRRAEDLIDVFQNKQKGYTYARQSNPTNKSLEEKITYLENGVETISFASGMAAIGSTFFALLQKGDHIIVSQFLFGNTHSLFISFERLGIRVSFVDVTSVKEVEETITPQTKIIFCETIANPIMQIADLAEIGKLAFEKKIVYIVDSTMTTPLLFLPHEVKATLTIHSLTKYFSGHANSLGGSVTDLGHFDWESWKNILTIYKKTQKSMGLLQIRKKGLRDFGATLSSFHAHLISCSLETFSLRLNKQCQNAIAIAEFFATTSKDCQSQYSMFKKPSSTFFSKKTF